MALKWASFPLINDQTDTSPFRLTCLWNISHIFWHLGLIRFGVIVLSLVTVAICTQEGAGQIDLGMHQAEKNEEECVVKGKWRWR